MAPLSAQHCTRANYNGLSSNKSPDIFAHCPSTCRTDLTKWPDKNAPVAQAIVKWDPQQSGKRQVMKATFEKWQHEYECEHQTMLTLSWLCCELQRDKCHLASLHCAVRKKYERSLESLKNFLKI